MISITKALNEAGKEYRIAWGAYAAPVITMPRCMLPTFATAIEQDLGAQLYDSSLSRGFMFNGIWFRPEPLLPRTDKPQDKPYACEA